MKLTPLVSTPTESISALAAAIVQRHKACLDLEADFDREVARRKWSVGVDWGQESKSAEVAFRLNENGQLEIREVDRTEEPTKVEIKE